MPRFRLLRLARRRFVAVLYMEGVLMSSRTAGANSVSLHPSRVNDVWSILCGSAQREGLIHTVDRTVKVVEKLAEDQRETQQAIRDMASGTRDAIKDLAVEVSSVVTLSKQNSSRIITLEQQRSSAVGFIMRHLFQSVLTALFTAGSLAAVVYSFLNKLGKIP